MKGSIDYAATIQIYAELFGKSSLGVFVYEDLVENPKAFIRQVCEFVGIDPEQAMGSLQSWNLHVFMRPAAPDDSPRAGNPILPGDILFLEAPINAG